MIPKKIFYIWIGSKLPKKVKNTIEQWSTIIPDYKIIGIDDKNDIFNISEERRHCKWLDITYKRHLWSFVSDYIRLKIIYKHGGIYLDTDITILKSFDDLLKNNFFAGFEDKNHVNLSVFGAHKNHILLKSILDFYQKDIWNSTLYTIPEITTYVLKNHYKYNHIANSATNIDLKNNSITLYPPKYFYPFHYTEKFSKKCITDDTYTIHWWEKSWGSENNIYWLSSKHLLHNSNDIENTNKDFYIKNTHKILRKNFCICSFSIFSCYKIGRFYLINIFKIPIILIEVLGRNMKFYLFSKIYIGSKQIK